MDPITALIASSKIKVGLWGKDFFTFLTTNFEWFFDAIANGLTYVLQGLINILLWMPPVVVVLAIAALAWGLQRSWKLAVGVALGLAFIINQGLWKETVETLVLVVGAAAASMAIGVPVGIWAAHSERGYRYLQPILDLMQTMPTFVYLIPVLILFGLGIAPGLIVTIVFACPAPIRLTYLGITSVPKPMIEAGEAFGATKRQLLWKVELPAALPTIMAGVNQTLMLSLSMVVIASMIAVGGLGQMVLRGIGRLDMGLATVGGLAIVILAIILDRMSRVSTGGPQ